MKNLMEMALAATQENVVKRSNKESVNESLYRILYEGKEKLTRTQLIARISLDRLINELGEEEVQKIATKDKEQFNELMKKTNKTVKNGLDTSWSHSNNNSSFHNNPKYKNLSFEEIEGGKLQIVDKDTKSKK